jgi:tetratricopeptide (TPR) repeat protein
MRTILHRTFCAIFPLLALVLAAAPGVHLQAQGDAGQYETLRRRADSLRAAAPEQALELYRQLERLALNSGNPLWLAEACNGLGVCYYYLNDLSRSQAQYFSALESAREAGEPPDLLARIYNNIAWNLQVQQEWDEALEYYRKSLPLSRTAGDSAVLERVLNNTGVMHNKMGMYEGAIRCFEESQAINRRLGRPEAEAFNLNNTGISLHGLGRDREAIGFFTRALHINYDRSQHREIANNLVNIGSSLIRLEEYRAADDTLQRCLRLVDSLGIAPGKAEVLRYLSELRERQGDYREALTYRDRYVAMRDSLYSQEQRRYVRELQERYESARRETELEEANSRLVRQKFTATVILAVLAVAVLTAVSLTVLYLKNKKWNRQLVALNAEIAEKSENLERMNEEIRMINENLETLVNRKTDQLLDQNEKLRRFGFVNAHKVRAPLARILGLITVLKHARNRQEEAEIFGHLLISATELDGILTELEQWLYQSDLEDRGEEG